MKKFLKWHQEVLFFFMDKLNLGIYQIAWISWIKGFLMGVILLTLCSCGVQFQYGLLNSAAAVDGIYSDSTRDITIVVDDNVQIDTIKTVRELRYKLRTDFNFRWDFAQYQINQPYNYYFYNQNITYWRPYNSFDFWWNRNIFWNDWAWYYPHWNWNYHNHFYGWHNWYRPYRPIYSWYNGPFNNSSYNVVWNSSRRNNIAYINGPRSSRSIESTIYNNRSNVNRSTRISNNNISIINNNINLNNDQIIKPNSRTEWKPESSNNGRWRWSRQVIPSQSTKPINTNSIQPRQIRGGSGTPVFQQTRPSINSGGQGRSSGGRGIN